MNNLLRYNSWAVLINDVSEDSSAYKIINALKEKKYTVVGISSNKCNIKGIDVYESLEDIPYNIDVVAIVDQPHMISSILEEIELLDIKNIWIDKDICDDKTLNLLKRLKLNIEHKTNIYEEIKR